VITLLAGILIRPSKSQLPFALLLLTYKNQIRGLPGKSHALNGLLLTQRVILHLEYYRKIW